MDVRYDYLYNRVLDISALIHITVKSFSMFVVIKYTPKEHRYHSYFILNIMFWNFACNVIFIFMHINPLYPAECFRLDGIASLIIESELLGHTMYFAEMTAITHCCVAMVFAFPYRYIVFAHPKFAANTKPIRVVLLCCGVHAFFAIILIPLGVRWAVRYDDYPEKAELPAREFVICLHPYGNRKITVLSTYLVIVVVFLVVITVFTILILVELRNEKHAFHSQTVIMQRKLFFSLLIITAITMTFGGIPYLICIIAACFPHLPYTRYTVMVCTVFLTNHGSIYSITYLILFKAYRETIKRLFYKLFGKAEMWHVHVGPVRSNIVLA